MTNRTFPATVDSIGPEDLSAYLKRKGWHSEDHPNQNIIVLAGRSPVVGEDVSVVFPSDRTMADYPARLRDAVAMIADFLGERIDTVIEKVLHWNRDVLKLRLCSPLQKEQLLPLDFASTVIARYRDFVAYAAATETTPRRFFAKITAAGRQFVEECLFGHTFVGSFGLTVECPLELPAELPMRNLPPPRPFKRAVMERIAIGYMSVAEAMSAEDPEIIVRNHQVGFSGNMCEVLTNIFELLDGRGFAQSVSWSPELPPPPTLTAFSRPVLVNQTSYEMIKHAAKTLQTVAEPEKDKVIEGRITRLRSEKPPLDTQEFATATRTIVILWEMENRQAFNVHVELQPDQYRQACDAHKSGRRIRITGKPVKDGKFWCLREHHDFQVI